MDDKLRAYVWRRSLGNPLFVRELLAELASGAWLLTDAAHSRCSLRPGAALEKLGVPKPIAVILTASFDQLPYAQQMLLRTGAVIGKTFSFNLLCSVYPLAMPLERVTLDCDALVAQQILTKMYHFTSDVPGSFAFDSPPISSEFILKNHEKNC